MLEREAGGADLLSREEVLAGLPARRASLLQVILPIACDECRVEITPD